MEFKFKVHILDPNMLQGMDMYASLLAQENNAKDLEK